METCKKASGSATLSPGIPVAKKKDTNATVTGTAVFSPGGIFTVGADAPNSKIKSSDAAGQTGVLPSGDTIASVTDANHATLAAAATTNGSLTIKLNRLWTSTITSSASTVKKCSGTIGTGLATDTAVTTISPVTTLVPGNCTTLASPTNGVTQFVGTYTTTYNVGGSPVGTVSGTLTAKSNGQLAQEALTETITSASGAASSFNGGTTTLTISFSPTAGDCVTTNITAVSIASVTGTPGKAITSV